MGDGMQRAIAFVVLVVTGVLACLSSIAELFGASWARYAFFGSFAAALLAAIVYVGFLLLPRRKLACSSMEYRLWLSSADGSDARYESEWVLWPLVALPSLPWIIDVTGGDGARSDNHIAKLNGTPIDRLEFVEERGTTRLYTMHFSSELEQFKRYELFRQCQHRNVYRSSAERFFVQVTHWVFELRIAISFPESRLPTSIKMECIDGGVAHDLGAVKLRRSASGVNTATWSTRFPKVGESYRMRWEW